MKPTCFNHQNFDPCRRSTPPPTPMLVSLYHARTTLLRVMMTSDINLKVSHTMLRSSSWPAHLHGDNLQKTLIFSMRYVDASSCCPACCPALTIFGCMERFLVERTLTALSLARKHFSAWRWELSICTQDVSKNAKASTHGGCV